MQKTQQIVLEREELIKNIQNKNSAIRYYMENMKSAKFVVSVLESEAKLIEQIYSQLDSVLVFVSNLEDAIEEEKSDLGQNLNVIKTINLKMRSSLNSVSVSFGHYNITSSDKNSVPYLATKVGSNKNTYRNLSRLKCNFSKWDEFIKQIELRIIYAYEDLKNLDRIEQDKESINSKLREIYNQTDITNKTV